MRLIFWVTALAVVTAVCAKNSTAKSKPKRQLESIRSAQDFQYSLVLPHSRVQQFRSLTSGRRISYGTPKSGKLPPYAVQMEPVVQYSQKDPLYDPSLDNVEDTGVNKNEITAQPKILNVDDQVLEGSYGPPYGSLPTAPLYSQDSHPHYYEAPEPIIEIIIKESNESLPAPPPQPILHKKKEPVQVFYVKYTKDPHHHDKVIYEKPIPAITPPSNHEDDHHEEYVTVTPEPLYLPPKTTTLRAIIKPESEVYHSDSSVKVTFGSESHYHGDNLEHSEGHEETAPRPAIAFPQPHPSHPPLERSASSSSQQYHDIRSNGNLQNYRPSSQQAQSRIQFQQPYLSGEPQLPKQGPTLIPFRAQPQPPRQNSFSPTPSNAHPGFANGPVNPTPHFSNIAPTVPGPIGPTFSTGFPRGNNGPPSFQQRPSGHQFASRPHFNNPPRPTFHPGPQRPFNKPQQQSFFDEAKYLAENYHTITTDQVDPPKEQGLPINRQPPIFNSNIPKPGPSPTPAFQEHRHPPQLNFNQQLPHQRPIQPFDPVHSNPIAVTPSRSPFFNLKPSPPHIEGNHVQFQQSQQHQLAQPIQQGFHNGPQTVSRPAPQPAPTHNQFLPQPSLASQYSFRPQQSPFPENSFQQNQPSERPQFLNRQPSERPLLQQFHSPSERPQILQSHSPSERPHFSQPQVNNHLNFHDQSNLQHQQNVGSFVPNNGELIASVPKYEQHITVSGPTAQPSYTGFTETNQLSPTASNINVQYHQQQQQQRQQQQHEQRQQEQRQQQQQHEKQQQQLQEQQQQQQIQDQRQQQQLHEQRQQQQQLQEQRQSQQQQHQLQLQQQQQYQQHNQQQQQYRETQQQQQQQQLQNLQQQQTQYQESQQQQQNLYDTEQEQLKIQLAENVKKQQEEIQRLQAQLQYSEQQQQQQQQQHQQNLQQASEYEQQLRNAVQRVSTSRPQQHQERSRQPSYATSTVSPIYFQSTSRTVEIKPTTQKYVSSTINSISSGSETKKEQKKKKPAIELPDEVPDDLRQQLLSSGILDNADISVLDYDKVGETPLESLPPDQLANFFSAGGGQQISSSELRPIVVKPNGDQIESRIDDESEDDQDIAASENVQMYVTPPQSNKQAVEMKVVHFDPNTAEGQNIAKEYVKENATQVDPVALNDKKYNRYLPLKVSGNQFPLPDVLKGRKVTSVVVLAPVETEDIKNNHVRAERAAGESLKGIKFVAGDSLQDLLKSPSRENFQRWLDIEKKTATDLQSVVLLVTGNDEASNDREIYMYDISSGNVNKLSGDLSNAFIEAADNNSLTKDIEQLAIEGDGIPEDFNNGNIADGSENVPFLVDLSGVSVMENSNQVSIASGYSKTKHGRSLRRP